ncbi:DUF771 domain-containing protein [Paenibacillus filicis]|uniref:DUF771 domain-containing protein n=1 Tax=Paenibacillus filicis TaxID=669464 RepID=A0ABU9DYA8_9BACL
MISIQIDEKEIKKLCKERVEEFLKEGDFEFVYWDSKELRKRTCLAWSTIQDHFFYDPRFPKYKIGNKWYFPAKKTREFLETWLTEQPTQ